MADGHGSTRLLTDTNGVISDRYSYDAYGVALDFTFGTLNSPRTAMLYSGERFDSDLHKGVSPAQSNIDRRAGVWETWAWPGSCGWNIPMPFIMF
jgi:hypothetical protein